MNGSMATKTFVNSKSYNKMDALTTPEAAISRNGTESGHIRAKILDLTSYSSRLEEVLLALVRDQEGFEDKVRDLELRLQAERDTREQEAQALAAKLDEEAKARSDRQEALEDRLRSLASKLEDQGADLEAKLDKVQQDLEDQEAKSEAGLKGLKDDMTRLIETGLGDLSAKFDSKLDQSAKEMADSFDKSLNSKIDLEVNRNMEAMEGRIQDELAKVKSEVDSLEKGLKMALDEEKMLRGQDVGILKQGLQDGQDALMKALEAAKAQSDKALEQEREERQEQAADLLDRLDKERQDRKVALAEARANLEDEIEEVASRLGNDLDSRMKAESAERVRDLAKVNNDLDDLHRVNQEEAKALGADLDRLKGELLDQVHEERSARAKDKQELQESQASAARSLEEELARNMAEASNRLIDEVAAREREGSALKDQLAKDMALLQANLDGEMAKLRDEGLEAIKGDVMEREKALRQDLDHLGVVLQEQVSRLESERDSKDKSLAGDLAKLRAKTEAIEDVMNQENNRRKAEAAELAERMEQEKQELQDYIEKDNRALKERLQAESKNLMDKMAEENERQRQEAEEIRSRLDEGNKQLQERIDGESKRIKDELDKSTQGIYKKMDAVDSDVRSTLQKQLELEKQELAERMARDKRELQDCMEKDSRELQGQMEAGTKNLVDRMAKENERQRQEAEEIRSKVDAGNKQLQEKIDGESQRIKDQLDKSTQGIYKKMDAVDSDARSTLQKQLEQEKQALAGKMQQENDALRERLEEENRRLAQKLQGEASSLKENMERAKEGSRSQVLELFDRMKKDLQDIRGDNEKLSEAVKDEKAKRLQEALDLKQKLMGGKQQLRDLLGVQGPGTGPNLSSNGEGDNEVSVSPEVIQIFNRLKAESDLNARENSNLRQLLEDGHKAAAANLAAERNRLAEELSKKDSEVKAILGSVRQAEGDQASLRETIQRLESLSLKNSSMLSVYFNAVRDEPYLDGGEEYLTFSRCTANAGGHMDPKAGVFTVPTSGAYLLSLHVCTHDLKKVLLSIRRNGQFEVASLYDQNHVDNHKNSMAGNSVIAELAGGDKIQVYLYTFTGLHDKPGNTLTQFAGCLLRPLETVAPAAGPQQPQPYSRGALLGAPDLGTRRSRTPTSFS